MLYKYVASSPSNNNKMKRNFFLMVQLCLGLSTFAQTGPGGVGDNTSNILWLDANKITGLADNADITTWADNSGNSNDLSQPNALFKPVYKTSIINGYPVVRFNKTNGRIRRNPFAGFATTAITAIYVNKNNAESGDGILSYASSGSDNDFLTFSSNNLLVYRGVSNNNSGVSFNDNSFHITNVSWQSVGGSTEFWKDGLQEFTGTLNAGSSITSGGSLALAGEQDAIDGSYSSAQAHFGDFSEVLIFNTFLNKAQHIIVSNYLAAKYNLTISNDHYAYQGAHPNEVAGIGREDASNTHAAAMSADILQIENASSLDTDGDYLLFGHDDADATTAWTTTEAPDSGTNIQRLAREWRLDETGDVGTVDFVVDTAGFPAVPAGHTMYALLVDSDGDFSSGASVYEMILSAGTEYTVTGIDITDGDYIAIAAVDPRIEHTITTSNGLETVNATIEVSLNFIPATDRTIDFTTADGTATAGSDYTAAVATTATIVAGTTTVNYTVTVIDNADVVGDETFTSTLSNPSVGLSLGANTVHTYTINDDDAARKVSFNTATSSGLENVSPVTVNLSLDVADPLNPTTVDYTVTGGTASSGGVDFTLASGTVTFLAGVTAASFTFTVNDDVLNEVNETIEISLSNPVNCNLSGVNPIIHTYTINDNDANPTIQFNTTSSTGDEATGSVNFVVDLDVVSGIDASATYTITGTATGGGVDYTLANGTVTIPAGSLTANINAVITNDVEVELNETIIITLSAPVNGILGGNTIHTYTITDNDTFGYIGPGGVGDNTSNILWLDANKITGLADNADITTWADNSGNSNDLSQPNALFKPVYKTSIINGYPVVRFNKTNGRIRRNPFTDFPTAAITAIYVNKNNGETNDGILSYASSVNYNDFLLFDSNSLSTHRPLVTNSGVSFNDNNWHISSTGWRSSDGDLEVWKDGAKPYDGNRYTGTLITAGGSLAIAGEQDAVDGNYDSGQAHFGDFPEIILYNIHLNTAQQIIVANYLSAKYNIAISNDFYNEDDAGDFDFDVAGIGQATDGSLHMDAKGPEIIRMNTPSDLGNDEYLFWGRNNQTAYTFSTSATYTERLSSNWRVSKRGDLGTVTVDVDMTGIDISGVTSCSSLQLVVDNDSDLASPTNRYDLVDQGGNIYRATTVAFADNDYFTIEYITDIVVDGTQFYNGSGASNVPDTTDSNCKLLVKGTASGSAATGGIQLTENADVLEVEIEDGGILGVNAGFRLQVTNGINLNATGQVRLVGSSQIVQTHTGVTQVSGTGDLFKDRTGVLTDVYQSGYWTSPVTTNGITFTIDGVFKDGSVALTSPATAGEALDITFTDIHTLDGDDATTPITISGRWLAKFINATDWTRQISPTAITFNPGEGWNMKSTGGGVQNYTFKGIPNDGTYTSSIDQDRLSLVGNPYPSALDADQFIADNLASITGTLYFYEAGSGLTTHLRGDYTGGYATRTSGVGTAFAGGSVPGQYIPIGQAFFVTRDAVGTGTITFQNSQRSFQTLGASSVFFSKNSTKKRTTTEAINLLPVLRIGLEFIVDDTKTYKRHLAIAFRNGSTDNYEIGFDAEMFDRQPSDLGLKVADKINPFVITGVNYFTEEIEIPLLLYLDKERTVTFSLEGLENLNASVYLYDNVTLETHNITDNTVSLTLPLGEYLDRFLIIFQDRTEMALSISDENIKNNVDVYFNDDTQEIIVNPIKNTKLESVKLYTILGQEIGSWKVKSSNSNEFAIKTDTFSSSIYFVKIKTSTGELSKKILITK